MDISHCYKSINKVGHPFKSGVKKVFISISIQTYDLQLRQHLYHYTIHLFMSIYRMIYVLSNFVLNTFSHYMISNEKLIQLESFKAGQAPQL